MHRLYEPINHLFVGNEMQRAPHPYSKPISPPTPPALEISDRLGFLTCSGSECSFDADADARRIVCGSSWDDDVNVIFVYNTKQLRLTFYDDEDLRLGYIISSNSELTLFDKLVINSTVEEVKKQLELHQIKSWEIEEFDQTENHFNENNWLILQSEFGRITKVEIGAVIKNEDDFDWKFKA